MKKQIIYGLVGFILLGLIVGGFMVRDTIVQNAQIAKYSAILANDPDNFEATLGLGKAYFQLEEYTKSADYYTKATELNAASAEAYNNLGNAYRRLLRYEDAEKAYLDAIGLAPDYSTAYVNIVALYKKWPDSAGSKDADIVRILESGITANPDKAIYVREIISYYKSVGNQAKVDEYEAKLRSN